jgi:predicted dehydrogenase
VLDDFRTLEQVHAGQRDVHRSRLRQDKGHRAAWEAFIEAIRTGGPPPIRYSELYAVTQASFAAVETMQTGQAVAIRTAPV